MLSRADLAKEMNKEIDHVSSALSLKVRESKATWPSIIDHAYLLTRSLLGQGSCCIAALPQVEQGESHRCKPGMTWLPCARNPTDDDTGAGGLQRYFEDPAKLRAGAGIDNPESSGTSSSSSKSQPRIKRIRGFQCQICFDETEKSPETIALTCDHRYCKDCYTSYLRQKIKEEGEAKEIQCMASKCNIVMDERTVELLVDEATCDRWVALNPQLQSNLIPHTSVGTENY